MLLALMTFACLCVGASAQVKVAVMPSYSQSQNYGNVAINEAVTVWGRTWGGTAPYNYTLDFGDGSAAASGTASDPKFISASHTYASAGLKTVTLTVTDSASNTKSKTATLRVLLTPTHQERVNMAIEKGLLYLYQNQTLPGGEKAYWDGTGEYPMGSNGAALLAFEENGHLPGNDYESDVYAETVQRGINYIASLGVAYTISNQPAGNPDTNGNGRGIYLNGSGLNQMYPHAFAAAAIVGAYPDAASAQAALIPGGMGTFSGTSFYSFAVDMMDQMMFCQNDSPSVGWFYTINTANNGASNDGSIDQWPNIVFTLARDRWNFAVPAWVTTNSVAAFKALQNANGACGYGNNSQWLNVAKTAGMLVGYAFGGKFVGDNDVDRGIQFIGNTWYNTAGNTTFLENGGWAGNWYAMYGLKKGLQIQGITTINTAYGPRDWYQDLSAWLLGNATLLDSTDPAHPIMTSFRSTNTMFGQQSNGRWTCASWPAAGDSYPALNTGQAILILTKSLTKPVPVAVIAAVADQTNKPGFRSFNMDGAGSYHLDPNASIVEYLWDWDASNGVDWSNPDASGPRPTDPGYAAVGNYTVTLRVKDNQSPAETATATVIVHVVDTDVAPIAVAITAAKLPAYSGKVGVAITLDGTSSYDPDGDAITEYSWDTDGNGTYGDAFGATTTVTFNTPHSGQVGLKVTAGGKTSTASVADIFATLTDLYVSKITASNIVPGTSADVHVEFKSDPGSLNNHTGVVVKFYSDDPNTSGVQVGGNSTVDLPIGGTATLDLSFAALGGIDNLYVYLDATKQVPEFDESNNIASVSVNTPELPLDQPVADNTAFAPGMEIDGLKFYDFFDFTLNGSGKVLAHGIGIKPGVNRSTDEGIWSNATGTLDLIVREGDPLPGGLATEKIGRAFQQLRLTGGGTGFFMSDAVTGSTTNNQLGWVDNGVAAMPYARKGTNFATFYYGTSAPEAGSDGWFIASLKTGGAVTTANDLGIWKASSSGVVTEAIREGTVISGTIKISALLTRLVMNQTATAVYGSYLSGVPSATNLALLKQDFGAGASPQIWLKKATVAPGVAGGKFLLFLAESTNAAGQILVEAMLANNTTTGIGATNNEGLWSDRSGSLALVCREHQTVPGAGVGVFLSRIDKHWLLTDGDVIVQGILGGTGVSAANDGCIIRVAMDGTMSLVLREGQALAEAGGSTVGIIQRADVSPVGNIVAVVSLIGGTGDTLAGKNDQIMVATTDVASGAWGLTVRKGDEYIVGPATTRTVSYIALGSPSANTAGGSGGQGQVINDVGQILAKLFFKDGTRGLYMGP